MKVERPWGWYDVIDTGSTYKVKSIQVETGKSLSLQRHMHRSEHWVVVEGKASVTKGKQKFELNTNQSTFIDVGEVHRLENKTSRILKLVEVQTGKYLGEDDIVRIQDKYGRKKK